MNKSDPGFQSTETGEDRTSTSEHSVQGFDDLIRMMQTSASSDADAIALAEGMGKLAKRVETIAPKLESPQSAKSIGPELVQLLTELRQHRQTIIQLNLTWRDLPEYANYIVALNNFRLLLNQWLMERSVNKDQAVQFDDFEALAWRTLGDGMLLLDMHRHLAARAFSESSQAELEPRRAEHASDWWNKLRGT